MAEQTDLAHADFIPYDPTQDPLEGLVSYDQVRIEGIPPSAPDDGPNTQQGMAEHHRQAAGRRTDTEWQKRRLIEELHKHRISFNINAWIYKCRVLGLKFDTNRLLRFSICRNMTGDVISLCRHFAADLTRRDILDRSAIFYALWPYPDTRMLTWCIDSSEFRDRNNTPKDLNHRDGKNRTLLDYAVKLEGADAAELLLVMKPDTKPEIDDDALLEEYYRPFAVDCWKKSVLVNLLLASEKLVEALPDHPSGFFEHALDMRRLSMVPSPRSSPSEENVNNNIAWLHFPWTTSFLRGCGRDVTRSIDTRGTRFIDIPGNPYTDASYISDFEAVSDTQQCLGRQVHIVFPCLVLRRLRSHFRTKRIIQEAGSADYFCSSVFQAERTLDESYFPSFSAENLKTRDQRQVVSREYEENEKPILNVPSLWIWGFGRNIVTTYSTGTNQPVDSSALKSLRQESRGSGVQIGLIIAHHISDFGNYQANSKFPPPLDIFERGVGRIVQEVDAYIDPNKLSRPDIRKEHDFMFRIADMREELVMIQHILEQQLEIVDRIIKDFENSDPDIKELLGSPSDPQNQMSQKDGPERRQAKKDWEKFKNSRGTIATFQRRAKKIDGDAERLEKRIQDQLNLKRTHVSINDAHTGLLLSTAVIGFTVITVIFAPLAFMTALFALPIDVLVRNQVPVVRTSDSPDNAGGAEPTATYTSGYVASWFTLAEIISLAITIILVGLSLWYLGGTEIFDTLRGHHLGGTKTEHPYTTDSEDELPELPICCVVIAIVVRTLDA
ncbi:hypothetical protein F5Y14DRAFT_454064 [Nemania sp. NC0429]|nr:hypothetical protein F5Y14DRAFT_454064 [Nemania sp. NC0429]